MKRLVTILILLSVILGVSIGGVYYIKITTEEISEKLTEISQQISSQGEDVEADSLSAQVNRLCEKWEKSEKILGTYLKHDDTGEIAKNLEKLRSYCQVEYFKEAIPLIEELKYSLHHLYEEELPTPKNIL